jgi:hypothetical protein
VARRETTDFILKIVFVLLAIAVIYIIILKHPNFIDWIKGLVGGGLMTGATGG